MIVIPICLKCEYCEMGMKCRVYPAQKPPEEICKDYKYKWESEASD